MARATHIRGARPCPTTLSTSVWGVACPTRSVHRAFVSSGTLTLAHGAMRDSMSAAFGQRLPVLWPAATSCSSLSRSFLYWFFSCFSRSCTLNLELLIALTSTGGGSCGMCRICSRGREAPSTVASGGSPTTQPRSSRSRVRSDTAACGRYCARSRASSPNDARTGCCSAPSLRCGGEPCSVHAPDAPATFCARQCQYVGVRTTT